MTKAKVAGEKPPSSRAGYKSPYFQKKRLRLKETPKEKRSNYFLRSPVSTYGAVMQMEPFLFSLSDNFPSVIPRCQQRTAESPCDSCIPIINEALSHFFMCKAFQECYPDILKKLQHNNSSIPCWKQSDQAIQQSVRHLCPYRCYLRAYSPFREWLFVRRDVHKVTDFPLDVLFDGWKCKLNYSVGNESLFAQNSSSETGSLPRVVFISPDGKRYTNKNKAIRAILQEKNLGVSEEGLVVSSQKEENGSSARKCLKWNEENKNAREIDQEKCATARMAINASWYIQDLESPLGLIEELFCDDPWRLLISTIFLNRTSRVQVDVVLHTFLRNWPTATAASRASQDAIAEIVGPLGLRYKRASGIIRFSKEYLSLLEKKTKEGNGTEMDKLDVARALSEKDILGLYFCGDYAYAAYKLFIVRDSRTDHEDHALHAYVDYQRAKLSHNDNSKALVGTM